MSDVETLIRQLAAAGAPSVAAPPYLAERVLATRRRSRRGWRTVAALAAGGLLTAGLLGARAGGESRWFETYIPSDGMAPTVWGGERVVSDRTLTPTYGDVVPVTISGDAGSFRTVRRLIGLPGDTVACPAGPDGRCHGWTRNGVVLVEPYAHGDPGDPFPAVRLGADTVFVLGDNRDAVIDSRQARPVHLSDLSGVAVQVRGGGHTRPVAGAPAHPGPRGSIDPDTVPTSQASPAG